MSGHWIVNLFCMKLNSENKLHQEFGIGNWTIVGTILCMTCWKADVCSLIWPEDLGRDGRASANTYLKSWAWIKCITETRSLCFCCPFLLCAPLRQQCDTIPGILEFQGYEGKHWSTVFPNVPREVRLGCLNICMGSNIHFSTWSLN